MLEFKGKETDDKSLTFVIKIKGETETQKKK